MEELRLTRDVVHLIDVDDEKPTAGQLVLAITIGGVLIETNWRSDSEKYIVAWMEYPKISKKTKEKLYQRYSQGGLYGNAIQRNS